MTSIKKAEPLVVERIFEAPVGRVWKAISHKDDLVRWFFDLKEFKAKTGFEFGFAVEHKGFNYVHHCKVTAVVPNKKLAFTWRYEGIEGDSLVTIELFPKGDGTRVKLTHEGLETFPARPEFARTNFVEGWTQLIGTALKDFVELSDREIRITRTYDAPRELVWKAMTDPKHLVHWWGPRGFTDTIEVHDFRVGGAWEHIMRGPDGVEYPNKSIFKEIVPLQKISFGNAGGSKGKGGTHFDATWSLEELAPGKTRLTARMVFPTAEARNFVVEKFGAIEGGKQTLEKLSEFLAKELVKPMVIERTFDAPRELVWKAWTERDRLMEWFGPKGFKMTTADLDFKPGGKFHYCLRTPDGKEMWGLFVYREIVPPSRIVLVNSFSDAQGGLTRHPFSATWPLEMLSTTTFTEEHGKTKLTIEWVPLNPTPEERETFDTARPGMNQGWAGTFAQLDEYLAKQQK